MPQRQWEVEAEAVPPPLLKRSLGHLSRRENTQRHKARNTSAGLWDPGREGSRLSVKDADNRREVGRVTWRRHKTQTDPGWRG